MTFPAGGDLTAASIYGSYCLRFEGQRLYFGKCIRRCIVWMTSTAAFTPLLSQLCCLEQFRQQFLPGEEPKWEYLLPDPNTQPIVYSGQNRHALKAGEETSDGEYKAYISNISQLNKFKALRKMYHDVDKYPKISPQEAETKGKNFAVWAERFVKAYLDIETSDEKIWHEESLAASMNDKSVKVSRKWATKYSDLNIELKFFELAVCCH